MSWIRGGKLERLAVFWHFTVAFQQRFPTPWGPFGSPCSTKPGSLCRVLFQRQSHWVITALWQADKLCRGVNKSAVIVSLGLVTLKFRYTASRPELIHQQSSWLSLPPWWKCVHSLLPVFELHLFQILRLMVLSWSMLFCWRSLSGNSSQNMNLLLVTELSSFLPVWRLTLAMFSSSIPTGIFFCWFLSSNTTPDNT